VKIIKPVRLSALTRVIAIAGRPRFHVSVIFGFPLAAPRALLEEPELWSAVTAALGQSGVLDEGLCKPRAEVLVCGAFHAPGGVPLASSYVRFTLGSVDKRLAVVGDRQWRGSRATEPRPIATVLVDWAHAFGGPALRAQPARSRVRAADGVERGVAFAQRRAFRRAHALAGGAPGARRLFAARRGLRPAAGARRQLRPRLARGARSGPGGER
jgi:hypothetical protein